MDCDLFKSNEFLPEDENILNFFKKDSVNRGDLVCSMYEMINRKEFEISSISIDGQWGCGKTFFVQMLIMLISVRSGNSNLEQSDIDSINDIYSKYKPEQEKNKKNHIFPVYYDAWKNDSMPAPILSLIYSICNQIGIKKILAADTEETIKSILIGMTKFSLKTVSIISGIPDTSDLVDPIKELFGTDSRFVPVIDAKELEKNINTLINKAVEITKSPLVIFVDELDRCKPTFAIQLLESVKHYFNNPKVLFVFSVNTEELQHSIKCVYGQGFDATRYLDRFFNIRFNLPAVDSEEFLKKQFPDEIFGDELSAMILALSKLYNLQLRALIKFYNQVRFVANYTPASSLYSSSIYENGYIFLYRFFIPIAICLKFHDQSEFEQFISGKGYKTLENLSKQNNPTITKMCTKYLKKEGETAFSSLQGMIKAYGNIFTKATGTEVGNCIFWEDCYRQFINKISFLG